MTSINGLEVKGVKYYPDHDGASVPYGSVYLSGKKVGTFRTDAWGGPMDYSHSSKVTTEEDIKNVAKEIYTKCNWHEFYHSFELLIDHLISFKDLEGVFKKRQKQGRLLLAYEEDMSQVPMKRRLMFQNGGYHIHPETPEEKINELENKLKEKQSGGKMVIYRSLEDFVL